MEMITELLKQDKPSLIIGFFIVLSAIIAMYEIIGKFSKIIGRPVKWVYKKEKDHTLILQTAKELSALQEKHKDAVNQSIKHDNAIKDSVSVLNQKVDALTKLIFEMKKIQDSDKLAEYKDKIGQSYRYYMNREYSSTNPIPYWNHMEKEALEGLINQYEEHGGKNSFVHSIVEPEIQRWKVID